MFLLLQPLALVRARLISGSILLVLLAGTGTISGCAPEASRRELTRTEYAYRLLDQGKNAEAILLLEEELDESPGNDEARTLLGSAFAGMAGISVYTIFDHFQDILFKRSLKDSVLDPKAEEREKRPLRKELVNEVPEGSPAQKELYRFDALMLDAQNVAVYLNRFPQIAPENWILLEEALDQLQRVEDSPDLCVYRVFIRLIYLKSYLVEEVLKDERFGTRSWACALTMDRFRPGADFIHFQIQEIYRDLDRAVNLGSKKLVKARNGLSFLADLTEIMNGISTLEGSASYAQIEHLFRVQFQCEP